MPKTSIDYSKTIIYKIEHVENEDLVYVGHTKCWDKRKCKHKSNCYNEGGTHYNLKLYKMIRDNGGWNMFRMIEVEKFPCVDKREAERRENEVMKDLKANMNTYKSYLTKEELEEIQREYKIINRVELNEKQRVYTIKNKNKIKAGKIKYREANIDKIKEYEKAYREKNKETIQQKKKEIMTCECGCSITKRSIKRHQSTKKNIDLMNKK